VGEPGAEAEELSFLRRDGVAVDDLACWAAGSTTRSWTIGGGSIGRRSADKEEVKREPDRLLQLHTFTSHTTHPSLLWLLSYNEIINSGSPRIVGVGNRASTQLGDSHGHLKTKDAEKMNEI